MADLWSIIDSANFMYLLQVIVTIFMPVFPMLLLDLFASITVLVAAYGPIFDENSRYQKTWVLKHTFSVNGAFDQTKQTPQLTEVSGY